MTATAPNISAPTKFCATIPCQLEKVRPLSRQVRDFLLARNVTEDETMACELAIVEACNNAVLYDRAPESDHPIRVEVSCDENNIEVRIVDHTHGFQLPDVFELPEHESEGGRGLFIIHSVMDSLNYIQEEQQNTFVMKKTRTDAPGRPQHETSAIDEMKRKLAESDQIISEMVEELSSCYETLSAIFRCGAELGKTNNIRQFSRALCSDLLEITDSDWYVLRVVPPDDPRLVVFVASENTPPLEPLSVPLSGQALSGEGCAAACRRDVFFDSKVPLPHNDPLASICAGSFGVVHPFTLADGLIGTLAVGKRPGKAPLTAAQANIVHTFADFLAIQIVNARLQDEQLKNRLVSRELEIAKTIQLALLPTSLPRFEGIGLAGYCESARQVGGDFYDVVQIDDHSMLLIIADVMGKGVPAAMFAAILHSLLRATPEYNQQPEALLGRINRLLFEELSEVEMFITAHLAHVDLKQRRITSACAGHCPILLGAPGMTEIKALSPEGIPLGILPDASFAAQTEELPAGSRLLLYTDGLTDAHNGAETCFGEQRILTWFRNGIADGRNAEELKMSLAEELRTFQGHSAIYDDQTFLIMADES